MKTTIQVEFKIGSIIPVEFVRIMHGITTPGTRTPYGFEELSAEEFNERYREIEILTGGSILGLQCYDFLKVSERFVLAKMR